MILKSSSSASSPSTCPSGYNPPAVSRTCLIVDDSALARATLRRTLEEAGLFARVEEAANGAEALQMLAGEGGEQVDLVLCDLRMPGVDGFTFLDRFLGSSRSRGIPVIVLTGEDELDTKVRALEAGAADYVTKPFEGPELLARVKVHQKMKQLRDQLQEANERLAELALRDPLTDLFNRRHWEHILELEVERCRRHRRPLSVLMLDIDHFKSINDRHGHASGDRVLAAVAAVLREGVRAQDSVARVGGEEFTVLLPETGYEEALTIAERLRRQVRSLDLQEGRRPEGGSRLRVRLSVGVATAEDLEGAGPRTLMEAADGGLYEAKEGGRDRVVGRQLASVSG